MESRVLKFRAWDKANNKMITTDFPFIGAGSGALAVAVTLGGTVITPNVYGLDMGQVPLPPELILMQFTGLTDKNGKEIYEGDIGEIKTNSGRIERFEVKWGIHRRDMKSGWTVDIPSFAFMVDGIATFPIANNYLNGHDLDIIEIIGNIYENPEYLTPQTA